MVQHDPEQVRAERTEVVANRASAAQVEAVATDVYAERRARMYKLEQALYLLFGDIAALIAIRIVLRLLAANPAAPFVSAIYRVPAPLLAPFVGAFGTVQTGGSVLEPQAIVALVVYALLAWLLVRLAWLIFGEARSGVATTSRSTSTRIS